MLQEKCPQTKTLTIRLKNQTSDIQPIQLANLLEEDENLAYLADKITQAGHDIEVVGMPAVCGLYNSLKQLNKREEQTGYSFFEIPGLPPSVPGMQIKMVFEKRLSR